jgi:glutaminase
MNFAGCRATLQTPGGDAVQSGDHAAIESPIQALLDRLHACHAELRDGHVAAYIPELAKADPDQFGIALATTDGQVYEVGDTRQPFTIQSISKPFVYGVALEDQGEDAVLAHIGVEPTGDAFNSISLAPGTGCPLNPMINAGAIAATSLVAGRSPEDRLARLLGVLSLYAGRPLALDEAVYESERATGHRNRAIGHMLRTFDILTHDPEPTLDLYFRQCSIDVHCRDLSVMAATLANGGINPVTGERAVRQDVVGAILSVMTTCGMYDFAGEWMYRVGMPAKSGVGGGVLAVLPGQLGIGVFSPLLDEHGNSVRGIAVCRDLARELDLHLMRAPRSSRAAIRAEYTLAHVRSKRVRGERESRLLDSAGPRVRVHELQGDLTFSAVEAVLQRIVGTAALTDHTVIDVGRVTAVDECARRVVRELAVTLTAAGRSLVIASAQRQSRLLRALEEEVAGRGDAGRLRAFPDLDRALEWCENQLLEPHRLHAVPARSVELAEHDACRGLGRDELEHLERILEPRSYPAGALIVKRGDPADVVLLLARGEVSVTMELSGGRLRRLATLSAGRTFGELAVVQGGPRTADVRADTPVECWALGTAAFGRLGDTHPGIKITVLENLLRSAAQMLARANQEVATLAS